MTAARFVTPTPRLHEGDSSRLIGDTLIELLQADDVPLLLVGGLGRHLVRPCASNLKHPF